MPTCATASEAPVRAASSRVGPRHGLGRRRHCASAALAIRPERPGDGDESAPASGAGAAAARKSA
jgi:hypothetical protein